MSAKSPSVSVSRKQSPCDVLQLVASITSQRDRYLLARTLVDTMTALINSHRISKYRILPGEHGNEAILVAETSAAEGNPSSVSFALDARSDFSAVYHSGHGMATPLDDGNFMFVFPIMGHQGMVGMLEMVSHAHTETDRQLIVSLLKVYSSYLSVLEESETDTLTGLLNRRTFDNNIAEMLNERFLSDAARVAKARHVSRRQEGDALQHWLAVMDIDHFKRVNDQFGHVYGDEVLLLLAQQMRRYFRQRDKLFRFGGEEFIVVLDRTSLVNARKVLERFRQAVEQYAFPQVGQVTVSIGFVRLEAADVPAAIVGCADQALYYAKEHGRNQVCFYEDQFSAEDARKLHSDDVQLF